MECPDEDIFPRKRRKTADTPPRLEKAARDDDDDDDDDDRGSRSIKKRRGGGGGNAFVEFLLFKKFVAPWVIFIAYWILVVLAILGGIATMIMSLIGMRQMGAMALLGVVYGLLIMIVYPIVFRIWCEFMICIFRIYETLVEIRDKL